MCGSDGLSSSSSLLICGKSCRCQAENPLNALPSFTRPALPFTPEVRANIDSELVAKSIDFMRRQKNAGNPFFLYLPFSMGHFPNLPSSEFKGKSQIGNFGDKLMEGDHHVGQILQTLKELGVDDDTSSSSLPTTDHRAKLSANSEIRERRIWAIPAPFAASWVK